MNRKSLTAALPAVLIGGCLLIVAPVASASPPAWNSAAQEISPPPGADPEYPFAELGSVSCGGPGSCSAVGGYSEPGLSRQAMIVSQVGGIWQQAEKVGLPGGTEYPVLSSISCPIAGNCAAVGEELDSATGLVVSQHNGVWTAAQEVSAPAGARAAWLADVACTADGDCTAVGDYEDSSGITHPMSVSESGGVWGSAVTISVPGSPSEAGLSQVSCPATSNCVALGWIEGSKAIVASLSAGTWSTAEELPEPPPGDFFYARELACGAAGSCVVGGYYTDGTLDYPAIVAQSAGVWGAVTPLTLPTDAATNDTHSELGALSCPSEGNCTAVGRYLDNTEAERAFSAREVGGTWQRAEQVGVPVPPEPEFPYALGWLSLDCVTAEFCGGVGFAFFHQTDGLMQSGSWGSGVSTFLLPPNSQSPEEAGSLYSVSCGAVGFCSAVGSYGDVEGVERAMALSTEVEPVDWYSLHVVKDGGGSGTVTSEPAGIDCGATCSHSFSDGTTITLSAAADGGSSFAGWSGGGCSGTGTCEVTLTTDRSVTATFTPSESGGGGGGGNLPSGGNPSSPASGSPPPVPRPHEKPLKCRKGFKRKVIRGRQRCVKVRKTKHLRRHD